MMNKINMRQPNSGMNVEITPSTSNLGWYSMEFEVWDTNDDVCQMYQEVECLERQLNDLIDAGYRFLVMK